MVRTCNKMLTRSQPQDSPLIASRYYDVGYLHKQLLLSKHFLFP